MADAVATSFETLNYSGMLFNKGNTKTPLLSMIGGKTKYTNSVEFVLGQEWTNEEGDIPNISESASLTAPYSTIVTRSQKTNVTQIFQEAVYVSYAKISNMGTLSGANIEGQSANPKGELDFQIANKMAKIARSIEKTFIQGKHAKATADNEANKTRGLNQAITTNVVAAGGEALNIWLVNEVLEKIDASNGDITNQLLLVNTVQLNQINGAAIENGLTMSPSDTTINGIQVKKLLLPLGEISIALGQFIPSGVAFLLDIDKLAPVEQPVPGKGNFFLEPLAKTGAGEKYQLFGQIGLDYANERNHGKITGLSTTFTAPVGQKVQIVGSI